MKQHLTRNEVAEMFGVTPQTISNYVEKGLLVESKVRDPKTKRMRILRRSVEQLLQEGYDVIELTKAIDTARQEYSNTHEEFVKEKDRLDRALKLMKVRDGFQKNIREISEILINYLVGHQVIPKHMTSYLIDLLSGRSWEYLTRGSDFTPKSIRNAYLRSLKFLAFGPHPSYQELKDEILSLKAQLALEKERIGQLEIYKEAADMREEGVIRIPQQLIGFRNVSISVRLYNALRGHRIENLYELALMSRPMLFKIRNCGRHSINEADLIMEKYGLEFDNINSLNNPKIQSMPGPFTEFPIISLTAKRESIKRDFNM